MFLTVCGLMATGTRTVLLSRWRTGGQTSYDLVREFVQELPFTTASHAWRRSAQLLWTTELDPELEPRVRGISIDDAVAPENPFFWAGYMLVDTGAEPRNGVN